jgi:transcriptional regulator with XRE-family HTH domain
MESDVRATIAAEVRAELARQNKTQRELAAALGLDHSSTWLRLRGERSFRAEELAATAEWLGVPIANFMPTEQVAS